jgi:hypothetical protein
MPGAVPATHNVHWDCLGSESHDQTAFSARIISIVFQHLTVQQSMLQLDNGQMIGKSLIVSV